MSKPYSNKPKSASNITRNCSGGIIMDSTQEDFYVPTQRKRRISHVPKGRAKPTSVARNRQQCKRPQEQPNNRPVKTVSRKRNAEEMLKSSPESGFEDSQQALVLRCFNEFRPLEIDFAEEPLPKKKCTRNLTGNRPSHGFVIENPSSTIIIHASLDSLQSEFAAFVEEYKKLLEPMQAQARLIVEAGKLLEEEDDPGVVEMLTHEILLAGDRINSKEFAECREQLNALKSEMDILKIVFEAN